MVMLNLIEWGVAVSIFYRKNESFDKITAIFLSLCKEKPQHSTYK
jgi:hypothetical protein